MSELLLVRIDGRRMPNVFPQNYCFFPPNLASVAVGNLMRLRRHRPNFTPLARARASPPLTRSRMIPRSKLGENPQQHRLARRGRCIEPLLMQEQADSIGLWGVKKLAND
jgi:hypothetical protein